MKKYNIIYADPPWKYWGGIKRGAASNHYPVVPLEQICALPVSKFAADNCALFLSWRNALTLSGLGALHIKPLRLYG